MILGTAVAAVLVVGGLYLNSFWTVVLPKEFDKWGQLGDFFGGTLNPIFGFLSVLALLITLVLQSKELAMSREELRLSRQEQANASEALKVQNKAIQKQSFEQTFFAWLATYRDILGEVRIGENHTGRAALRTIWGAGLCPREPHHYRVYVGDLARPTFPLGEALKSIGEWKHSIEQRSYPIVSRAAIDTWERLYNDQKYQLDSLFRVLYRLIYWVHKHEALTTAEKWEYVSIARSQLSWIEMVALFYNGHTRQGAKFKSLIETYALFDNLDPSSDPIVGVLKENPPDSVGYAPAAYSSDIARALRAIPPQ